MSTYYTIITNNGKQQFATAAQTTAKVNITHLALGDGNGNIPTPSATRTALVKEKVRVAVNKVEINATNRNWIEIHAIIPSSSGGYTVRELGLYAGTTLIAIGSFPATYKPSATEGGAREMSIKAIIAVDNASVVNVTLDNSLVYATQKWVEDNFVNHNEVINTLTATDTDKPLSAAQGKALQDNKADKTTTITAGNGLTGGGTLQASRTVALGTPSQITASTTNSVTATSHTHAIDKASTTVSGVVQLNDTLASTATDQALTANQGKVLNDKITTANADIATKANQATTITAGNGLTGGGTLQANRTLTLGTPSQITASTTNSVTATSHTHAIDKASTTVQGIVQLNDTLASTATDQALTANQGKVLNDKITTANAAIATKANQATTITAGNGLTGGGTLQASRTVALGTPSQITASTTNSVTATSHTHAIDKASTTVAGVVQLVDNLTTDDATKALTANQGKVLNDKITTANADIATKANQATTITAGNGLTGGGTLQASRTVALGTPSQITASTTNSVTATSHTHAIDKASTTVAGVVQLVDNLTTDDATKALTAKQGKVLNDTKLANRGENTYEGILNFGLYSSIRWSRMRWHTKSGFWSFDVNPEGDADARADGQRFNFVFIGTDGLEKGRIAFLHVDKIERVAYQSWVQTANVASATKLQTARTISTTGDATWSVSFDGSANASGALTLANSGVTAGSYNAVTVDSKGRVTRGLTQVHGLITATTATGTANQATTNGNTYLNIVASGVGSAASVGSSTQVTGTNGISISSDTAGKLIISRDSNSPTASKLQTARTINGVAFDGTQNITIYDNTKLASNANAVSASRLATARTISLTGAVTGSVSFDGSGNVSIATTLSKAVVREYNSSFISSIGATNYTIPITGQVVTGADGRITQYIHLQHFRDVWFAMNENSVGNYSHEGTRSRLLQIPLWTAMPNKVLSVSAQAMRSTNATQSIGFFGEAGEHQVAWAKRQQGINKTHAFVEMARYFGGASEEIDMLVIVEGY